MRGVAAKRQIGELMVVGGIKSSFRFNFETESEIMKEQVRVYYMLILF
jgi:hypothetical protein